MIGAFLIGLFGSVHCLSMCSPLAMTFTKGSGNGVLSSFVMYHTGRLLVYAIVGVLFGLLSLSMIFFQFQQFGAIVIGVLIVLIYGFPRLRNAIEGTYYRSSLYRFFKARVTRFYGGRTKWFAAGVLNGLLPCGLVYLAAAGAVLTGGLWASVQFMVLFGAGTLPMFLGLIALKGYAPKLNSRLSNLTTPIALLAGMLLIIRGVVIENPNMNELLQAQMGRFISVCGF